MTYKTDAGYNEDDFVQSDEVMQELTVTITLCEYRNLIRENERLEMVLEDRNNKIWELTEELEKARKSLALTELPDAIKSIGRRLARIPTDITEQEDDSR